MTGRRVLGVLGVVTLSTVVIPPVLAYAVNARRVERARQEVATIATALRTAWGSQVRRADAVDVLSGPGLMPVAFDQTTRPWVDAPRGALASTIQGHELPVDPWGNSYLVNVAAGAGANQGTVWILSAGPNGIVETPFRTTDGRMPAGNDVAARLPPLPALPALQ